MNTEMVEKVVCFSAGLVTPLLFIGKGVETTFMKTLGPVPIDSIAVSLFTNSETAAATPLTMIRE